MPGRDRSALGDIVLPRQRIALRVAELAREIDATTAAEPLVAVCVLKGSFVFAADLVRALSTPVEVDFIAARSYTGTRSRGAVELVTDVSRPLHGRDVLLVEDIIDTGATAALLLRHLRNHAPRSLRVAALLTKPRGRAAISVDFCGFALTDEFVVGYGLDLDERWRELPDVHRLVTPGPA